MTLPNVSKLLLISPASLARPCQMNDTQYLTDESHNKYCTSIKSCADCMVITSLAPERDMFSDPARSTKFSLPHLISSSPSGVASLMCIVMENKECDRLHQNQNRRLIVK